MTSLQRACGAYRPQAMPSSIHTCSLPSIQVPVVNSSDQMVYVTANMQGGDAFTGPKDIMVGPGQTASYPLTFCAPWVGDFTGSLELTFPASG